MQNTEFILADDNVVGITKKLEPEERDRILEIGRMKFAPTTPAVYLCGQCRATEIDKEQGVCPRCAGMIAQRAIEAENLRRSISRFWFVFFTGLALASVIYYLAGGGAK